MLQRMGFKTFAYDWRGVDISDFEQEILTMRDHGIGLCAWWMPPTFDETSRRIVDLIVKHDTGTDLWITGGGEPATDPDEQQRRLDEYTERLRPTVEAAAEAGVRVGLYNHGGWYGRPANQLQLIERFAAMGHGHVRMVFNLHHGRGELDDLAEQLEQMKPHLIAFNLNGTAERLPTDHTQGPHILPVGEGGRDVALLRTLVASGWCGPVGILCHTDRVDAEQRLADNLDGVAWVKAQLEGRDAGPKPAWRSWPIGAA